MTNAWRIERHCSFGDHIPAGHGFPFFRYRARGQQCDRALARSLRSPIRGHRHQAQETRRVTRTPCNSGPRPMILHSGWSELRRAA